MAEKLEDINLPVTVIARIVKDCIPEGAAIAKEARTAFAKIGSVFVLYITSASTIIMKKNKKKTLLAQDTLEAMKDIELDELIEPLTEALEQYKQAVAARKSAGGGKKKDGDDSDVIEALN